MFDGHTGGLDKKAEKAGDKRPVSLAYTGIKVPEHRGSPLEHLQQARWPTLFRRVKKG
jgi:hypothetical protein